MGKQMILAVVMILLGGLASPAFGWQRVDDTKEARRYFGEPERWLTVAAGMKRASVYWDRARPAARRYGVPEDLFFGLALCESGFNPFARSGAGAEGMFQFMPATGRAYGLMSRADRRNISKSSNASARHLRDLHRTFGSWDLALAAYNAGSGNVRRAIRRAGSRKWLRVRRFLPNQTFSYVPKIRYVAEDIYPRFLNGENDESYQLVVVGKGDTLYQLAKRHQTPIDMLRRLNGSRLYAGALIVVPNPK